MPEEAEDGEVVEREGHCSQCASGQHHHKEASGKIAETARDQDQLGIAGEVIVP